MELEKLKVNMPLTNPAARLVRSESFNFTSQTSLPSYPPLSSLHQRPRQVPICLQFTSSSFEIRLSLRIHNARRYPPHYRRTCPFR
jgi:hypothetical protein